jgi:small subunit ribosomal protein S6
VPLYESIFIVRPDVSGQHVDGMAESFATIVGEHGGRVTKTENWGLRSLAYRIKKNRKGHYVLMNVDAPAPAMAELKRNMSIDEDVVRYLTVRVDELESGPSAVMQSRGGRDDRPRRDRGGRGERRPDGDSPEAKKRSGADAAAGTDASAPANPVAAAPTAASTEAAPSAASTEAAPSAASTEAAPSAASTEAAPSAASTETAEDDGEEGEK